MVSVDKTDAYEITTMGTSAFPLTQEGIIQAGRHIRTYCASTPKEEPTLQFSPAVRVPERKFLSQWTTRPNVLIIDNEVNDRTIRLPEEYVWDHHADFFEGREWESPQLDQYDVALVDLTNPHEPFFHKLALTEFPPLVIGLTSGIMKARTGVDAYMNRNQILRGTLHEAIDTLLYGLDDLSFIR